MHHSVPKMASSADETIAEIQEELELHRVILQSLDDSHCSRPDAAEQRQETLDVIKELETKLAELRSSKSPSRYFHHPISSASPVPPPAQLDGPSSTRPTIPSSPPQFGRPAFSSLPSRPRNSQSDMPRENSYARKRRFADDDEDDVGQESSKRAAMFRTDSIFNHSSSSTSRDASSPSDKSTSEDDGDDLLELLGLDTHDMRALKEEQRQAERWLEERKEQERRDEQFARTLLARDEPSPPRQAPSSPIRSQPSFPGRSFLPPTIQPEPQERTFHQPTFPTSHGTLPLPVDTRPTNYGPAPSFGINNNFMGPQFDSPRIPSDSDEDSDLAEITPGDFHLHTGIRPTQKPSLSSRGIFVGPDSGAQPYYGAVPGPSGPGGPRSIPWADSMQSAMATLRATRDHFMGDPSKFNLLPSHSSFKSAFNGLMGNDYPNPLSRHDLQDLYDHGTDSKQLNEEIKQLLETIRPDADIAEQDREGTPEALKYSLLDHQKLGLAWMKSKEESEQKGGILADDMGLGKTLQAIALMVSRPPTDSERKTTLIIAPVALMQQWKREIQKMLRPGHQLSVYVLHGDKRAASFRDLKQYDVVLTTFGTLSSELNRVEKYDELLRSGAEEPTLTRQYLKTLPCLGPTSKWYRVIIDEAQCIKNRNTKAALSCCRLNATYRWCMSGTPMMNNVGELHSLLKFLRNRPYGDLEKFQRDFGRPLKSNSQNLQNKAMTQLRVLLKAVLLRRTKDSKINGKPILDLKPRISEKVHAAFSDDELEFYRSLENRTQLQFNRYLQAGTVGRNYSNILVLLLRLRQACCHPHLISDFGVKLNETTEGVDFIANAKEFSGEVVIRLRDNDDLECPICIDAVDNPIIFFPCGHGTCSECFSRISDPSLSLQQGIDGAMAVKCPNCRGVVDPKKITDHASFRKVHFPESSGDVAGLDGLDSVVKPTGDDDDDDATDDSDDDEQGTLSGFIVNDSDTDSTPARRSKGKGKGKMVDRPRKTLAELKKEAAKNQASKRKYLRRLEKTWITSAKIEKTMEIVRNVDHRGDNEKTIVFSQFTSLLDLLEVPIAREGHHYRRYDGSMKPADRNSAVMEFTDNPDCKVMLVSLKAGNSGLNLVAANHVVIFDPFWNPYIEEQAIDRAHRIGQLREVFIHRILVPETVEDRIIELQDKKRALIDGALDEKESKNIARLSTRELAYLFGINN